MRKVLLAIAVLVVPVSVSAQITDCPNCVLGVYDDQGLTKNFGDWDATIQPLKSVFVGIKYDPALIEQLSGLTSIELSVDGIPSGPFGDPAFRGIPDPTVTIGTTMRWARAASAWPGTAVSPETARSSRSTCSH